MEEVSDASVLRTFVYETLCHHERLEVGQFRLTERVLRSGTTVWGVMYRLVGPRQVQASAIWVWDKGKLMFYGSSGRKFQQSKVSFAPGAAWRDDVTNP